ncbi:MAG: 5'/3'-nucleotidase SurE [Alphaproteobacteria bacterium]|nr:5'/3'-nucleotidase SurE [Alphaproteobacteria bacterium]MCB9690356.1 5'/3'-nucleotidase SurE [Alphaproteobacteria bacterium]
MKLLVTNDDGVHAPGLLALAAALGELGEVWVVAPEREQSAQSHAFTLHKPLRVTEVGERRIALSGTPADCSYAAIHGLVPRPDLVVSGINRGANLGSDVHYSGTVAAAREAVLQGVPAIAASLYIRGGQDEMQFERAAAIVRDLASTAIRKGLPDGTLLNVNVPNGDVVHGVRPTVLGRRRYTAQVEERQDPRGRRYVWIGGAPIGDEPIADSDVEWARRDWATVTPLHIDPTARTFLEALDGWL